MLSTTTTACSEAQIIPLSNVLDIKIEDSEEVNKKLAEHSQSVDKALDDSCDVIRTFKKQLAEKNQAIENWKTIYESVMQTCNNDAKEIERLREQLAEKDEEIKDWKKAYELAIFELDFARNHSQTTNEETMNRIEQLYETIYEKSKSLKGEK